MVPPAPAKNVATNEERVSLLSGNLGQMTSWPILSSLAVIAISALGFGMTHVRLMRRGWETGMRYAVAHPLTDAAVTASVLLVFLSVSSAFVR
jgi:hypothetical protein